MMQKRRSTGSLVKGDLRPAMGMLGSVLGSGVLSTMLAVGLGRMGTKVPSLLMVKRIGDDGVLPPLSGKRTGNPLLSPLPAWKW